MHSGAPGLFLLSIADSSFLTLPLGNDLLIIVLSAGHPRRALWYAVLTTVGSVIGCALTSFAARTGETHLEKRLGRRKRLSFIKYEVDRRVGWLLAIACLMPPPFPFTPVVVGAAAFGYPKWKLLAIVASGRFARFTIESALAVRYGSRIISFMVTSAFRDLVYTLIAISFVGSALSIYHWIRASRKLEV